MKIRPGDESSDAEDDDLVAIQEAIEDMDAGDTGIPFEEFDREFRARHNLPTAGGRDSSVNRPDDG
jgi:hypothetical protein